MQSVDFLNLEYLLLRVYNLFSRAPGVETVSSAEGVSNAAFSLWVIVSSIGLLLALILLILFVIVRIKLARAEHDHHAHETHEEHAEEEAHGNPRWERIMEMAGSSNENDWRRAILEADTLLSDTLTERGYLGEGVGEQLKGANPLQFTTLDLAWQAHKVRNQIAHRHDVILTERDARATIDLYFRVFEEFGVI